MFDVVLHRLYHHDGVVNHDADREHDGEHCERIDGKAQCHERRKSSHQRNGNRQHGNERRAEVAEKDEYHDQYEDDRISQCEKHLMDGNLDELRSCPAKFGTGGLAESFAGFLEQMANVFHGLDGIRAGELVNDQKSCGNAVFASEARVALAGKFRSRDVLHSENRAVRQRADDHVLEFGGFCESALHVDGVLELRARFGRRLTHLAGRRRQGSAH